MDDNNAVIYTLGYYLSKINGIMKFTGKWVGIEKRLMNDITQTPQREMFHILSHVSI
jgi:hypothetical protein